MDDQKFSPSQHHIFFILLIFVCAFPGLTAAPPTSKKTDNKGLTKQLEAAGGSLQTKGGSPESVKRKSEVKEFSSEVYIELDFFKTDWTMSPEEYQETTLNKVTYAGRLMYGLLLNDYVEPFIEAFYTNEKEEVANFTSSKTGVEAGAGVLFNLPFGVDLTPDEIAKGSTLKFSNAATIPYGGFLFSYKDIQNSQGSKSAPTTGGGNNIITKIIVGIRFVIFQHFTINSNVRYSYQSTVAAIPAKEGGKSSKSTLESQVIGLSLLF